METASSGGLVFDVFARRRGNIHVVRQQYGRAIADYGRVIALEPDIAAAYSSRGTAYQLMQQYHR